MKFDPLQPVELYTEVYQTAKNGDVVLDENGAPLKSWRMDDPNHPRQVITVHSSDGNNSVSVPSPGYCHVTPEGAIYEFTADGNLRREIPGPASLTEVRDASGTACVYDRDNRRIATLGADERLTSADDGSLRVVRPDGGSQALINVVPHLEPEALLPPEIPAAPRLPGFADYLSNNQLTPIQQTALAAELARQNLGSGADLTFIGMPDGSTLVQNADGDIVGQLNLQPDGTLRWSGLDGQRNYIQPDGIVQDQQAVGQAAAIDAVTASRTATAVGLMNTIIGLQDWEAMSDLQRAAAVVSRAAVEDNKIGYRIGTRINIDVLNAEQQLHAARRDLFRTRVDLLLNGLKLRASAGLLEEADLAAVNRLLGVPA